MFAKVIPWNVRFFTRFVREPPVMVMSCSATGAWTSAVAMFSPERGQ